MIKFRKASNLLCLVLFVLFTSAKSGKTVKNQIDNPNIIFVLVDDMGIGDVGAFNPDSKIATPHINALASSGMKFIDAHTSSAVCTPTRYGLLTGRYNWRSPLKSGVVGGDSKALIPTTRTTVAKMLKDNGYHTSFIGKWHLGWNWQHEKDSTGTKTLEGVDHIDFSKPISNGPNDLGFDYTYGLPASLDMAPYVYVENGKTTEIPNKFTESNTEYGWWRKGPTAPHFVHQDVLPHFFEKAFDQINYEVKSTRPFFMYLALPSPHTPMLPTQEWQGKSGLNPYADYVMEIDDYIGQLEQLLKEKGIDENTLIFFTSDNGCTPDSNYPFLKSKGHDPSAGYRGHKADIFEGGHREPFIVKWPGRIKPGKTSDITICTTDFMRTCADILNIKLKDNEAEDSFSLVPILLPETSEEYKRSYTVHHSINGSFAIREGKWKMIFCPGSGGWSNPRPNSSAVKDLPKYQLYDLEKDFSEKHNLYGSQIAIENHLKSLLRKCISDGRSTAGQKQNNDLPLGDKKWTQIKDIMN
jgi:arylsulfatase A-like enzyme